MDNKLKLLRGKTSVLEVTKILPQRDGNVKSIRQDANRHTHAQIFTHSWDMFFQDSPASE